MEFERLDHTYCRLFRESQTEETVPAPKVSPSAGSKKTKPIKGHTAANSEDHKENHDLPAAAGKTQSSKAKSKAAGAKKKDDTPKPKPRKKVNKNSETKDDNAKSDKATKSLQTKEKTVSNQTKQKPKNEKTKKAAKKAKKGKIMKVKVQGIAFGKRRRSSNGGSLQSSSINTEDNGDFANDFESKDDHSPTKRKKSASPVGRPKSARKGAKSKSQEPSAKKLKNEKKGRGGSASAKKTAGRRKPGPKQRNRLSHVQTPAKVEPDIPQLTTKSGRVVKRKISADDASWNYGTPKIKNAAKSSIKISENSTDQAGPPACSPDTKPTEKTLGDAPITEVSHATTDSETTLSASDNSTSRRSPRKRQDSESTGVQ